MLDRLCGLVVRVPGPEFRVPFPAPPDFLRSSGSGTGSTQPHEYNWGPTWKKRSGSGLETENTALGFRRADHVVPSIRRTWH
jgi:hypothetical protein